LYAKTLNLGGTMVWSLDQDDYTGLFCRQGPFPFTRRVHDTIFSSDKYSEQELFSSTKSTKLRTKQKFSFIPIQKITSQREKSTLTTTTQSSSKSKTVKNSSFLCLLFIVLFLI
jgi:GH18 family chitinase